MRRNLIFVMSAAILAAMPVGAMAEIATLTPIRDNTLYETFGDPVSNGSGEHLFAGHTLRGAGERRAVLYFDVAGAIPAGAIIESATLTLYCSRSNAGPNPMSVHRVTTAWGEGASNAGSPGGQGTEPQPGDSTWTHASYPSIDWASAGGDFIPTPSATTSIGGTGPVSWPSTALLVADVQLWLDSPTENFGWIVVAPPPITPETNNARRFESRENVDSANRPHLSISFSVPVACPGDVNGSGTVDLTDLSLLLAAFGTTIGDPAYNATADLNSDNSVTLTDLSILLANFGANC